MPEHMLKGYAQVQAAAAACFTADSDVSDTYDDIRGTSPPPSAQDPVKQLRSTLSPEPVQLPESSQHWTTPTRVCDALLWLSACATARAADHNRDIRQAFASSLPCLAFTVTSATSGAARTKKLCAPYPR